MSIGLSYKKEPVLGVALDVMADECFVAWKNGGAYLNKKPIKVDATPASTSPRCAASARPISALLR